MFAQVPLFPDQASTSAERVDALFFFILAIIGSVALLVTVLIGYFSVRYRRRSLVARTPSIRGSIGLETFWTIMPLLIFLGMFLWGARLYFSMARPPDDAMEIYVVGKQWMWKLQHMDGQREINTLHVPIGRAVKLTLTSEDVIHDFAVPAFRLKIDVLPGRYVHTWFQATRIGEYHLFCDQYCGTNHSGMVGKVIVMDPQAYEAWLGSRAEGSLALEGRKLFLKLQCVTCHSANARARAPVLEDLFGSVVHLQDNSTVVADESYLRESILRPQAKIVAGWRPIMPTYQGQVTEADLIQLIAYLKALKPGQTPVRTEEADPPVRDSIPPE